MLHSGVFSSVKSEWFQIVKMLPLYVVGLVMVPFVHCHDLALANLLICHLILHKNQIR